ncbi:hypothetical protein [Rhizobium leguminosarum]
MDNFSGILNSIAKGLSKKAEALLPFGLAVIALGAIVAGVDPWLSCGFAGVLYCAYMLRSEKSDKHEERMAQLEIEKLDHENAARLEQAKQRLLAKKPK